MADLNALSSLLECDANDDGALATAFGNTILLDTTGFVNPGALAAAETLANIIEALEVRIEALETP